jgi:hypothetical protein
MVYNAGIQPLYRPRSGTSGGAPLITRFEAIRTRALRELKPDDPEYHVVNSMVSEQAIDAMEDAIAAARKRKEPVVSPQLQEAWATLCDLQRHYNEVIREIEEAQKLFLWRCRDDWRHRLLRSTKPEMLEGLVPVNLDWDTRDYPDVPTTRAAQKQARAELERVLELRSLINNAVAFNDEAPAVQAMHLCHALYDDSVQLRARVTALEAQLGQSNGKAE